MNGGTEATSHVPQLRALLFTDLCDSTTLVERIGDAAAAELFQQHDRLVLAMQQRWRRWRQTCSPPCAARPCPCVPYHLPKRPAMTATHCTAGAAGWMTRRC